MSLTSKRRVEKTLIYMTDLSHTGQVVSANVHPLGIGVIAAYALEEHSTSVEIELFKYPEDLAQALESKPPDIMGFGAFAIMEYRRHTRTGAIRQCLLLQTTPFPDATCPSKMTIESPVHVFEQIV